MARSPPSGRDNKANCGSNVRNRGRARSYTRRFQLRLVMPADGRNGPASVVVADTLGVPENEPRRLRAREETQKESERESPPGLRCVSSSSSSLRRPMDRSLCATSATAHTTRTPYMSYRVRSISRVHNRIVSSLRRVCPRVATSSCSFAKEFRKVSDDE